MIIVSAKIEASELNNKTKYQTMNYDFHKTKQVD